MCITQFNNIIVFTPKVATQILYKHSRFCSYLNSVSDFKYVYCLHAWILRLAKSKPHIRTIADSPMLQSVV